MCILIKRLKSTTRTQFSNQVKRRIMWEVLKLKVKAKVLVVQSCPTLCNPKNCSPAVSPVHGRFSGQEHWIEQPLPSPGDRPNPGIKPGSPTLQADSLPSEPPGKPLKLRRGWKLLEGCVKIQIGRSHSPEFLIL